jgi:hypothetical protein
MPHILWEVDTSARKVHPARWYPPARLYDVRIHKLILLYSPPWESQILFQVIVVRPRFNGLSHQRSALSTSKHRWPDSDVKSIPFCTALADSHVLARNVAYCIFYLRILLSHLRYGLDGRGVGVRVPVGSRIFSSPRRPDRFWGPPSLLSIGYRGSFAGVKRPGLTTHPQLVPRSRIRGSIHPLPHTPSWHSAYLLLFHWHDVPSICTLRYFGLNWRCDHSATFWPPVWSSGQSFWLQIQRPRVRFPAIPDFLRSSGSGMGSTQTREDNWGTTWRKK